MKRGWLLLWMALIGWATGFGCEQWERACDPVCFGSEAVAEAGMQKHQGSVSAPSEKSGDTFDDVHDLLAVKTFSEQFGERMFRVSPTGSAAGGGRWLLRRRVRFLQHQVSVEEECHAVVYRIGRKGEISLYTYALCRLLI